MQTNSEDIRGFVVFFYFLNVTKNMLNKPKDRIVFFFSSIRLTLKIWWLSFFKWLIPIQRMGLVSTYSAAQGYDIVKSAVCPLVIELVLFP